MPTISYKGYDFDVDHQPTQEEFAQMQAQVDKLPAKGAGPASAPAGEEVDINKPPKEVKSVVPAAIDAFKVGLAGALASPNLAVDLVQEGLDKTVNTGKLVGKAGALLREKIMGPADNPEDAKKQWFLGNAPDKENLGGYKQAKAGWEAVLRADRVLTGAQGGDLTKAEPVPTNASGKPSKANEYITTIANFLGGSLIPGAGAVASANRKLLTAMVEIGSNTASGLSAVEGKKLGGDLGPKFGLTKEQGEQFGEAAGGIAGPGAVMAAGQLIAKTSQVGLSVAKKLDLQNPFDKAAQKEKANVILNQEIIDGVQRNPSSAENLTELARLQSKIKNFQPGIAQATNSPELIAMTKQVSQASPEALAAAVAVDQRNAAAIAAHKEANFPTTNQPLNTGARAKFSTDDAVLRQDIDNTTKQLDNLSTQYDRSVDKTAIGEELRKMYWEKRQQIKSGLDKQIDNVYKTADDIGIKADMTDIRDMVKRISQEDGETFQNLPGTWKKILAEFGGAEQVAGPATQSRGSSVGIRRQGIQPPVEAAGGTTETSFEKLHSLYREANREKADLIAAQKLPEARKVGMVLDALQAKVNQFQGPQYGMLGEKFGQYNQDYSAYSQAFKEGGGGKLAERTKRGFGTDAENIVDKVFLQSGDKAKGMDDFFRVYGNDERAAELLRDGIVDNFSRSAVDAAGNFSAAGARRWMKNNDRAMEQMPNLRAELQGTTDTAGALIDRRRELVAQRQILDKSVLASAAREQRPEMLVEAGMKDPRMFKALLSSSKTPESQQSLARAIVDMTVDKGNPFAFLQDNKTVLKPVLDKLGKDHWDNLMDIAKAEEIAGRVKAPTHVELGRPQDIGSQTLGTSVPSLLAKVQNVKAGRTNEIYQGLDVLSRFFYKTRTEELQRLRQAALTDPDVAGVMADVVRSGKASPQQLLDLKRIAFANGISVGSHALATAAEHSSMTPEEKKKKNAETLEGAGLWRK